jgi:hypothetical protein
MMPTGKKVKAKFAPISIAELAVRMCEASYGLRRPPEMTGGQALEEMEPDCRDGWLRAAHAAMNYWEECIDAAMKGNPDDHA